MSIALYMDQHVPDAVANGLIERGVNVLTARADGHHAAPDSAMLARATELGRVLFTQDEDFLIIGAERQRRGLFSSGIVYGHQQRVSIGDCVEGLELLCKVFEASEIENQVIHLRSRDARA